jgi:hypothetical protein
MKVGGGKKEYGGSLCAVKRLFTFVPRTVDLKDPCKPFRHLCFHERSIHYESSIPTMGQSKEGDPEAIVRLLDLISTCDKRETASPPLSFSQLVVIRKKCKGS